MSEDRVLITHSDYLARVGTDGHIYVQRASSSHATRISWAVRHVSYGVWLREDSTDRVRHLWPTWSPSGSKLACVGTFGPGGEEQGTAVFVLDVAQGIESWEVWTGGSSAPMYMNWAFDEERLFFVIQQEKALSLQMVRLQSPGEVEIVLNGMPLFHGFSPDGQSLAVHLGGKFNGEPGRRLYQIDMDAPDHRLTLTESPGDFGTPAWSPEGKFLAFTVERGETQEVQLSPYGRATPQKLGHFEGLGTLVWSWDGTTILAANSPSSQRSAFEQLWQFSMEGIPPILLLEEPFIACYPTTGGRILIACHLEDGEGVLWKLREKDGTLHSLSTFYPSQPQRFLFQFFHQFRLSHRTLSADGSKVIYSGYKSLETRDDSYTLPLVWVLDLDGQRVPEALEEGPMAFWAPVPLDLQSKGYTR